MKKNADHTADLHRLRRISGQIEGLKKMIEDRRYCLDILTQTKAVRAAIKALETSILEKHIDHCVSIAFESKNKAESQKKMAELLDIFSKRMS